MSGVGVLAVSRLVFPFLLICMLYAAFLMFFAACSMRQHVLCAGDDASDVHHSGRCVPQSLKSKEPPLFVNR